TVLSIALVVYLLATLTHEGLGHGTACLLTGGDLVGVSTAWCDCDKSELGPWAVRVIKAAGCGANLLVGSGALLALRWAGRGATAYFLWLLAAVNLFLVAGYLLVSPVFGFGDWAAFLEGLPGIMGLPLIAGGVVLAAATIHFLLPHLGPNRVAAGRTLALLPWAVVGGGVMSAAAMLNVHGVEYAFSSALATFGGTSFLAWMYRLGWGRHLDPITVQRSSAWIVTGLVALVPLVVFGRGLLW
ncbi:MAG: hypothetical protein HN348_18500, partial [Proteobacteria bacterium]|nr:hypothetical protein [Pseudomonadota bacterium]